LSAAGLWPKKWSEIDWLGTHGRHGGFCGDDKAKSIAIAIAADSREIVGALANR